MLQADGWFANGFINWTSGNNIGLKSPVKLYVSESVELFLPTTKVIQIGIHFIFLQDVIKTLLLVKTNSVM